jgi:phosphoribosyl-AMP cyclohydrolase
MKGRKKSGKKPRTRASKQKHKKRQNGGKKIDRRSKNFSSLHFSAFPSDPMFASTVPPPTTESAYVELLRRVNITSDALIDSDLSAAQQQSACQQLLEARAPPRLWLRSADIDQATRWLNAGALRVVVNEGILVEKQSEWLSSGLPVARIVAQCEDLCSLSAQRLEHLSTVSGAICAHLPAQGTWMDDDSVTASIAQHIKDLAAVASSRHQKIFIASEFVNCAQAASLVRLAPDSISLLLQTSDFDTAASDLPATPTDSAAPSRRSFGALVASLAVSDRPDGLLPTVVCDEQGCALGLVYSNAASLDAAIHAQKGIYWSRRRGLWEKGLTSGAGQDLLNVSLDCDSDCLRFVVHQHGAGFCHLERRACWPNCDTGIPALLYVDL